MQKTPNYCFYSSFIFITNAIVALLYNKYIYASCFALLFITSILHRIITNIFTNILDKIAILSVALCGLDLFLSKFSPDENRIQQIVIITTLVTTIYLYCYGYCYQKYCYDNDIDIAHKYHAFLHIFASLGHHLILLL
jgi:hypothetical protein